MIDDTERCNNQIIPELYVNYMRYDLIIVGKIAGPINYARRDYVRPLFFMTFRYANISKLGSKLKNRKWHGSSSELAFYESTIYI